MEPYFQYIILLGAVVIVSAFILPRKKSEAVPEQSIGNMEIALEQFMENIEKENEELLLIVKKALQDAKTDAENKDKRIVELERKYQELTQLFEGLQARSSVEVRQSPSLTKNQTYGLSQHAPVVKPIEAPIEPVIANTMHARYSDLFQLYAQGKSIEMIAKKLNMNKGEVQLIIGLAKQEEAANA